MKRSLRNLLLLNQVSGAGAVLTAPSNLAANAISGTEINLTWTDTSSGEQGWKVERSLTGAGVWTTIAVLSGNQSSYSDTGLSPATGYDYRVRSYSGTTNGSYSNTATATTSVAANRRYVDPVGGNDANAGTSTGAAWKTIEKAFENGSLAQGYTLYLMAGTHNEFKSGTDDWINPVVAAGDSSGMVYIRPNPGDEGAVIISMPASTSTSIGYFHINLPGITFSWHDISFINDSGGNPVAADWFYVRQGKHLFTNVLIDNKNLATKVIFNYKLTSGGGEVEVLRSTIQNADSYVVFYNVGGTFKMRSSVLKGSDGGILFLAAASITNISMELINNTFYGVASMFAFSSAPTLFKFVNNIVNFSSLTASVFNTNSVLELWASTNVGTGFLFTNNVIWYDSIASMAAQPGWNTIVFNSAGSYLVKLDKSNRLLSPGFTSAPSDLTIAASSHIMGRGNNSELPVNRDINGAAWIGSDVGAYAMSSSTSHAYSLITGKVAFLGDSIFGGAGSYFGADANVVYRRFEVLTGLISVDAYIGNETYKPAVSGGRVQNGPWLADYVVDNHQPSVIFVSIGINNVYDLDTTADNKPTNVTYQQIADVVKVTMEKLEDYGVIPIWMGITSNRDGTVEADAINAAVEAHCIANGWLYGSILDRMRINPSWQTDYYNGNGAGGLAGNLHPDADGHELMALLAQELYEAAI